MNGKDEEYIQQNSVLCSFSERKPPKTLNILQYSNIRKEIFMTEKKSVTPAQRKQEQVNAASMVLAGVKETLAGMQKILQNYREGPKGTTLGAQQQALKDAEDRVYRASIVVDAMSGPTDEADKKRPSEKTSVDIHVVKPQPQDEAAQERLVRWANSELKEEELIYFKDQCQTAKFLLSAVKGALGKKPSIEECDKVLKTLMQAHISLLGPRRMLVGLKGYDIPTFKSKQVDKGNAAKEIAQFDNDIDKAIDAIEVARSYCDSDGANPDFKPFADALDLALGAISDADAALKCYEETVEKKKS